MSAWEDFLVNGNCALPPVVRKVIKSSWERCQQHGVKPSVVNTKFEVSGDPFEQLRQDHREMLQAFKPVEESLSDVFEEARSIFLLADPQGVILESFGNQNLLRTAKSEFIASGTAWDEIARGTNAIGTAIELKRPVEIHAAEHYCEWVKSWSCSAAPVIDKFDGELLGVVNVTSLSNDFNTRNVAVVISTALQLQEKIYSRDLLEQMELNDWYQNRGVSWKNDNVILLDQKGRIIKVVGYHQNAACSGDALVNLKIGTCLSDKQGKITAENISACLPDSLNLTSIEAMSKKDGHWRGGALVLNSLDRKGRIFPVDRELSRPLNSEPLEPAFARIVGESRELFELKVRAKRFALTHAPVLIQGESGCGKELFAHAIHEASNRAGGPFLPVNCGTLMGDLAASELFGYENGAFTGASRSGHAGKFEEAHGGTLFLDEVGELPGDIQVMLLRVLQDGVVVRIGSNKQRRVSTRIIAATNRDLAKEVEAGVFRQDLYYRLKVLTLDLPPLREHPEDVVLLANFFMREFAAEYDCTPKTMTLDLQARLCAHEWPGNARELKGTLESMFVLCEGNELTEHLLPQEIRYASEPVVSKDPAGAKIGGKLSDLERNAIMEEIERFNGNLSKAAENLSISRSTLYRKLKKYDINCP